MKRMSGWIAPALVLLAYVLSTVPGITQAEQLIDRHKESLIAATISLAALGFTVFIGGILSLVMASGEAMTHEEIEATISSPRVSGDSSFWRAHWVSSPPPDSRRQTRRRSPNQGRVAHRQ